ncbi:class I SAM-dependent methyltransferase [Paenibacillus naphthalenovorans]|uniref:Phospholipid methyltransferase n=1 Tax=Paenibacillus naphthalenovorans TaxID=162209 RepID=A0A0U2VUV5_9BACL|nr:phospholipid methyltransferase [Paenibacillus naphthalenovorans]ALS23319.1 phospholipid methyltransferase [Paenibacillus naphthalenovorans]
MNLGSIVLEKFLFLNKFIQSPKEVGSVTPSSGFLAKAMTRPVAWDKIESVAELGAGTGALTKYIEQAASGRVKVLLFEKEPVLRYKLAQKYPAFACYADACGIQKAVRREKLDGLDVVISGLPFFNFPQEVRDRLIKQIISSLKPGGSFIAFQYSLQMKPQLRHYFDIETIRFVPFNLPPAFVYVCRKKADPTS